MGRSCSKRGSVSWRLAIGVAVIAAYPVSQASAGTAIWVSSIWSAPADWVKNAVPASGEDIDIATGAGVALGGSTDDIPVFSTPLLYLGITGSDPNPYGLTLAPNCSITIGTEYIGSKGVFGLGGGNGTQTQASGSSATITNLFLGHEAGFTGLYFLYAGTLSSTKQVVGENAEGMIAQRDATTNTVNDKLVLGSKSGIVGSYLLQTESSRLFATNEFIGDAPLGQINAGQGFFTQQAGLNEATSVEIARGATVGTSQYSISGGRLNTTTLQVGLRGSGLFQQTGGDVGCTTLTLGTEAVVGSYLGDGKYELKGGYLLTLDEIIGDVGRGSMQQSGGLHAITGTLTIGNAPGTALSGGSLLLSGGTMSAVTVKNNGSVVQTGGTLTIGDLENTAIAFTITGGDCTVEYSLKNSALGAGMLVQTTGVLRTNGTVTPNGVHVFAGGKWYDKGTLQGGGKAFIDGGAMEIIGQTTIESGSGLDNSGSVVVDSGVAVQFQGGEINNSGTLQLIGGAALRGSGSVINNGFIQKPGGGDSIIEPNFTSNGTIDTGSGSIELAGAVALASLSKVGGGKLTISGAITPTTGGGMAIYDGRFDLKTDAGGLDLLALGSQTEVHLMSGQHIGSLGANEYATVSIDPGAGELAINEISLKGINDSYYEAKGKLDVGDGTLKSYDLHAIDYLLATPLNLYGGGIVSGTAGDQGMVLGYKKVFDGPDPIYVLIQMTTPGDTDMDGTVSASDAAAVQAALDGTPTGNGDANYDGVVNAADLSVVNQYMDSTAHDIHLHWGEVAQKVAAANTLSLVDSGGKTITGHIVNNLGTIALSGAGDLTLSGGASISNVGTFDVQRDGNVVAGSGSFINSGVLRKIAGTGVSLIPSTVAFSNPGGTIDVQVGTIRIDNTLQIDAGSSLAKTGAGTLDVTGALEAAGAVTQTAGTVSTLATYLSGTYAQSGGLHQQSNTYMLFGSETPGAATYTLTGGELRATVLSLGYSGATGRVVQSGGTVTVGNLVLGGPEWGGGSGVYDMSGGQINASGQLMVGGVGMGTFNQSGGDVSLSSRMLIGYYGGSGQYTLSGGTIEASYQQVGDSGGSGAFTQSGGTTSVVALFVGTGGGTGTYSVSGGSVIESGGWMTSIGHGGTGTLNVSGTGSLSTTDMYVGNGDTGVGSVGVVNQSGGSVSVLGTLRVAHNGASGVYNLSGGTLSVGADGLGAVVNHGTFNQTSGTVTAGDWSGAGAVTVAATGSLTANFVRQDSLTVNGTGLVSVRPTGCGDGPGQASGTSVVKYLTMGRDGAGNPTGRIDIANNHLVVDWSAAGQTNAAADVTTMLRAAYNTGNWDGNGLTSSRLAGHWSAKSIGMLDNSAGYSTYTSFGGQSVPVNSTLVRYTLAGDTNLDGTVDFIDLAKMNQSYNQSGTYQWWQGDFNYDGAVDFLDWAKLSQNYNQTLTCPEGGGQNMMMGGGGMNSSVTLTGTLTGVDGEDSAAELAVLDELRAKMLAHDPGDVAAFDAFVAQWWGDGAAATAGGVLSEAEGAAAFAAVPEPSLIGVVAGIGLAMSLRRGRRVCR